MGPSGQGGHGGQGRQGVPGVAKLVAVGSGKGGVGKSTVAVNLALALVAAGCRVGILDADIHGPNVPLLLGVRRRENPKGLAYVSIAGNLPASQRPKPLERHGLRFLSLALYAGEEQHLLSENASFAGHLIRQLLVDARWGPLDYLLIDLPPGTGEPQITLSRQIALDGVVLVVTPQDLALLDTTRSFKMFRDAGAPVLGVVENMSYFRAPDTGNRYEIFGHGGAKMAAEELGLEFLGEIPLDQATGEASDAGVPVTQASPDAEAARAFMDVAEKIAARCSVQTYIEETT